DYYCCSGNDNNWVF
nr:immunoglobulin light chain junction region [Macaca mulatta]MOW27289.1 immunoglobulin light chain junction region [Macaca mulatta]MOW27440.1 immunoglobulin light chain junction region [Macaca mulatta]MOW27448.1 immunoglobulin light chain junction region [Macaca mulatta]MOW27475.1 immunoglobulin light chain junction region [Macaca mulatta]